MTKVLRALIASIPVLLFAGDASAGQNLVTCTKARFEVPDSSLLWKVGKIVNLTKKVNLQGELLDQLEACWERPEVVENSYVEFWIPNIRGKKPFQRKFTMVLCTPLEGGAYVYKRTFRPGGNFAVKLTAANNFVSYDASEVQQWCK